MTFTRKKSIVVFDYNIIGQVLKKVDEVKDLEIVLDSKLCFDKHINFIFRKCNKLLGFISRACSRFKSKKSYIFLYNSLVRSLLEYGSVKWNPFNKVYTYKVESVQKKFTRLLYYKTGIPKADYENRLAFLNMYKLSSRRMCIDETCLFKIINGHIDSELLGNIISMFLIILSGRSEQLSVRHSNIRFIVRHFAFSKLQLFL